MYLLQYIEGLNLERLTPDEFLMLAYRCYLLDDVDPGLAQLGQMYVDIAADLGSREAKSILSHNKRYPSSSVRSLLMSEIQSMAEKDFRKKK